MSQLLINEYLKQLDVIKKMSGSSRETIVREAFKDSTAFARRWLRSSATFMSWTWAATYEPIPNCYESVAPFPLKRTDIPDEKARSAGLPPKALLRADKDEGIITLDSETSLRGIPSNAWDYKLGNRCALEWVLDQHNEKKPKDPTIREKFNTYRFADYKKKVIDLLARVTTVSVETMRITDAMGEKTR